MKKKIKILSSLFFHTKLGKPSNLIHKYFYESFDDLNLQKPTYCGLGGASEGLAQIPYLFVAFFFFIGRMACGILVHHPGDQTWAVAGGSAES